jgi:predicted metal-dependent peptidase
MQIPASVTVRPQKIVVSKLQEARALVARDSPYLQNLLWTVIYHKVTPEELGAFAGQAEPLSTMIITGNGVLLYTQEFVDSMPARQLAGVVEHELWHLLSDHGQRVGNRDRRLANVAMDIAINGMLLKGGRELPPTECTPEFFGFAPGLVWEQYYELLQQHPLTQQAKAKGEGDRSMQGKGKAGGQGQETFGQCGGGAGNPLPGEGQASPGQGKGKDGEGDGQDPMAGRSQDELSHARQQCAAAVQEAANKDGGRGIGHLPGGMLREIEDMLKPAVVPWHAKLARRLRRGTATRPGMVDYVHDIASRRMCALRAMGRRAPVTPRMVSPMPRVLVAIDTSGSMGDEALAEAMSEVDGILRAAKDEIAFISCDTQVNSSGKGARWQDVAGKMVGGGGTCIRPMFDYVEAMRRDLRPNLMVVFTDGGFGDCPEAPPSGVEVVWVLVGSYKMRDTTRFGEVIEVPHDGDEPE